MSRNENVVNISLDQYASFGATVQLLVSGNIPVPITTSWSFSGSIRYTYNAPVFVSFSMSVIDYTQSIVSFGLGPRETGLLTKPMYVYDILATDNTASPAPGTVYRVLEGQILPNRGVTISDIP